jgi:hypothetical protein
VSLVDALGVAGVLLILVAYAGAQLGRLNPRLAPALVLNLAGAGLILWSLAYNFNLSAVLMEGSWALVSVYGLVMLVVRGRPKD